MPKDPQIPENTVWVRVKDPETGHEYDVHRTGDFTGVQILGDYPANNGKNARPMKPRTEKDGVAAKRGAKSTDTTPGA